MQSVKIILKLLIKYLPLIFFSLVILLIEEFFNFKGIFFSFCLIYSLSRLNSYILLILITLGSIYLDVLYVNPLMQWAMYSTLIIVVSHLLIRFLQINPDKQSVQIIIIATLSSIVSNLLYFGYSLLFDFSSITAIVITNIIIYKILKNHKSYMD